MLERVMDSLINLLICVGIAVCIFLTMYHVLGMRIVKFNDTVAGNIYYEATMKANDYDEMFKIEINDVNYALVKGVDC